MQNNSPFVKVVIWLMIFLMSIGFAALVIVPFAGNTSLFGGGNDTRGATLELLEEARDDVKKDDCANEKKPPTGKRLDRCKTALDDLAAAYKTLTVPDEPENPQDTPEPPKDYKENLKKATDAYELLYSLDESDAESTETLAAFYRDQGLAKKAIPLWEKLVKRYPENDEYLLQEAQAYQGNNENDKAKAAYKLFMKKFPERESDVEAVKEVLAQIEEQEKAAAAGGAGGATPITVG